MNQKGADTHHPPPLKSGRGLRVGAHCQIFRRCSESEPRCLCCRPPHTGGTAFIALTLPASDFCSETNGPLQGLRRRLLNQATPQPIKAPPIAIPP